MIQKILIATDGSEVAKKAGAFAIDMASQLHCQVAAIFVADLYEFFRGEELAEAYVPMRDILIKELHREGTIAIDTLKDIAEKKGVNFEGEVIESDNPAKEILKTAKNKQVDLIVVGSHGKTGILDYAMGSVTTKLLHLNTTFPITIVQAERP